MRVAVHYHAAKEGAAETLRAIQSAGGSGATFAADLAQPDAPAALMADVIAQFGTLDVVVNSAAVMHRTPFASVTPAQWDDIMALNFRAPFFVAQAAAPHLRRADGGGAIVNVADLAAFETWPAYIPHGLSKAGIVHMTRALARILAPEIRVAAVAPGTVLLPENWSDADAERLRATTPLQRHGDPEDVAATVLFLLESDFITGDTIIVDGGRHVRI